MKPTPNPIPKQSPPKPFIKSKTMELLAPAGTVESFRAAIDSGANAVYVGLVEFSARMRARNFTVKTLSYAVPYAHARNVKVYVAFNTLVKQNELEHAVHMLYQLDQIGVDGIIVQDFGIAGIVHSRFPNLALHASTQMSIHNSAGLKQCQELGFRRAVLARELTLTEIAAACDSTKLEIEVFVHGALCYSLSGMCLASSFFGGSSGNRGRCTQVCRRSFDVVPKSLDCESGYFFSPNDLCVIDALPKLAHAGVKSLKIEGRMKGAEYVSTVVSAYRMALDNPDKAPRAKEMLRRDMGRRKTMLFVNGMNQTGIIDAKNPAGTGIYIGSIDSVDGRDIVVTSKEFLTSGDMIRVQAMAGAEGVMALVAKCDKDGDELHIMLDKEVVCAAGDILYCVGRASKGEKSEERFSAQAIRYEENFKEVHSLLRSLVETEPRDKNRDRRLFVKIDNPAWLPLIDEKEIGGIICAFDFNEMKIFAKDAETQKRFGRSAYIEPPPFIPEAELTDWRSMILSLCKDGECGLLAQNLGHVYLGNGVRRMRADYLLWCMNRVAHHTLQSIGLTYTTCSLEDDSMNVGSTASQKRMAYLFGHVPLFISRMQPGIEVNTHIVDRQDRKTVVRQKHGLYYLIAEETVSLFNRREKYESVGISTFIADLSFMKPDAATLSTIVKCYNDQTRYPESCMFNFKGGLK